jgi:vacuolar protein sorting-associated protein 41
MTDRYRTPRTWDLSLLTSFQALQRTIHDWPKDIYDISAVIVAIQSELDHYAPSSSGTTLSMPTAPDSIILMECLAEL